jgi:hypothetical protein
VNVTIIPLSLHSTKHSQVVACELLEQVAMLYHVKTETSTQTDNAATVGLEACNV